MLQEHWLTSDNLTKHNALSDDYNVFWFLCNGVLYLCQPSYWKVTRWNIDKQDACTPNYQMLCQGNGYSHKKSVIGCS